MFNGRPFLSCARFWPNQTINKNPIDAVELILKRIHIPLLAAFITGFAANPSVFAVDSLLDLNGTTVGFGGSSGSVDLTTTATWTTDITGDAAPVVFPVTNGLQIGNVPSDFSGGNLTVNMTQTANLTTTSDAFKIVSTNVTVNLIGTANCHWNNAFTWTVPAGSILNISDTGNNNGFNFNSRAATLAGGGVMNFASAFAANENAAGGVTENMPGGTVQLNQTKTGSFGSLSTAGGFTLTAGNFQFVSPQSLTNVFQTFVAGGPKWAINGGTIDNLTGSAGTINLGSGTYSFGGSFTFAGSSSLNLNTNAVALTANSAVTVNANTLAIGGVISGNGFGLTESGGGTLALYGAATFVNTPQITLADGTFDVTGLSHPFSLGSGQILALAGDATVNGSFSADGGTIVVGTNQLTLAGNLTLNSGTAAYALGDSTNGNNGVITIAGNLNLSGTNTIQINYQRLDLGRYKLITYTDTKAGSAARNLVVRNRQMVLDDSVPGEVDLLVTGMPAHIIWTGADAINPTRWDNAQTATNWLTADNVADTTHYYDGDLVTFSDANHGQYTVNLATAVSPGSLLVSNSAGNYVFGGGGMISGTTSLVKQGSGSLTLAETNGDNFTGQITVDGGTLAFNVARGLSATWPSINVNSSAVLDVSGACPLTLGATQTLSLSNATLAVGISTFTGALTTPTLILRGTTNWVNVVSLPAGASFPLQLPVINYTSLTGALSLGLGSMPAVSGTSYVAYLSNNVANSSVDLVVVSGPQPSSWVYYDGTGKLAYKLWGSGNKIMDFSSAGYQGGGVALPDVATVQTLNPSGGDDTAALQGAINTIAGRPLTNGFCGALQLGPGTFYVSSPIYINSSGVVVRGSGSGAGGTTIVMTNASTFTLFNIAGSGSPLQSGTVNITDSYVPSGTTTFQVSSVAGYNVGDKVIINRTVTTNWIHYMGMDTLVRNGATQTWIAAGSVIATDRTIQQISGTQITLDAPLTDSFDAQYLGTPVGTLAHYVWPARISEAGLEHLRIQAPPVADSYASIYMDDTIDSWVRDVAIQDGVNCVTVTANCKQLTLDQVVIRHTVPSTNAAGPADFAVTGTQILLNQCQSFGTGSWAFVTQSGGTGPIVALNFSSTQQSGISPHQRWTTGILADNCSLPNAPSQTQGIAYHNRGTAGSGQGWTTGWSVAWNVVTPYFLVSAAPGTENWCIGGIGTKTSSSDPDGIYSSLGSIVAPHSLYLEQLRERLGGAAVENIGYPLFTISNSPAVQTISAGTNTTFSVIVGDPTLMSNLVTLSVSGLPANAAASFNTNSVTGSGNATLTITASNSIAPGNYTLNIIGANAGLTHTSQVSLVVGRASGANLKWNSAAASAWNVQNSFNWFNFGTGVADQFYNDDNVLFDDTPGVVTNVTISGGVTVLPAAVTNNSSTNSFTISGAGGIGGSGQFVKLGTSTFMLATSNSFTGGVMIGGGTLSVGNAAALGGASGVTVVTNGGTLNINGFNLMAAAVTAAGSGAVNGGAIVNNGAAQTSALRTMTLAGDTTIGGTGRWDIRNSGGSASLNLTPAGSGFNLTKIGTNQITFVGVTPIDPTLGNIDIQQGTLGVQTSTAQLGDPNKTLTVYSGATLELWTLASSPLLKKIVVNGGGTIFDEKGPSIITGPVTLNGTATFNVANYGTPPSLTMSNIISGSGGFSVVGGGNLVLAGTNTYTGGTTVSSGTLILANNGSISGSTIITVSSGAMLDASGRNDATLTLANGQMLTGNGIINGRAVIGGGATLAPGGLPGILSFNNNLTLTGGSVTVMELNQTLSTNDVAQVAGTLTYGGTLLLTNMSGTLTTGDSFKLFNAASYLGAFTNHSPAIPGINLAWNFNGLTNGIVSIVSSPTPPPRFVQLQFSGTNLVFNAINGVPNWPCLILASTNLVLPLNQWTTVATNSFDGSGRFSLTNSLIGNEKETFYRLQIN